MTPHEIAIVAFLFLTAPLFASFMMVVVYRLPIMIEAETTHDGVEMTLSNPPSHCEVCGKTLTWLELIPIVSWCLQGGACRGCGTVFGKKHVLIEVAALGLAGIALWLAGPTWLAMVWLVFLLALIALTLIDLDHYLAPDAITLPVMWLGLLVAAFGAAPIPLRDAVFGAAAGYLFLWLPGALYTWKNPGQIGMGLGDAKMLAMVGAFLGPVAIPYVVLVACVVGLAYALPLKKRGVVHIPFAPAIAAGAFIVEVHHAIFA